MSRKGLLSLAVRPGSIQDGFEIYNVLFDLTCPSAVSAYRLQQSAANAADPAPSAIPASEALHYQMDNVTVPLVPATKFGISRLWVVRQSFWDGW